VYQKSIKCFLSGSSSATTFSISCISVCSLEQTTCMIRHDERRLAVDGRRDKSALLDIALAAEFSDSFDCSYNARITKHSPFRRIIHNLGSAASMLRADDGTRIFGAAFRACTCARISAKMKWKVLGEAGNGEGETRITSHVGSRYSRLPISRDRIDFEYKNREWVILSALHVARARRSSFTLDRRDRANEG